MKSKIRHNALLTAATVIMAVILGSCSTTRRIPDDEMLYTGVKKISYNKPDSVKLPAGLTEAIYDAVDVPPNNYWKLFHWRYPFPLGLWAYNNWPNPEKGLRHKLYEWFAREPVLVSDVRPDLRSSMIKQILDNNGYFSGTATYRLNQGKNKKKASIIYEINPGLPYPIDSVAWLPDTTRLFALIDTIAQKDSYLSNPGTFAMDSLSEARTRITNRLRNRGYYFFQPQYIEYLADSLIKRGHITLKLDVANNAPKFALRPYKTGDVTLVLHRAQGGGRPDTMQFKRATLVQMKPSKFRKQLVDECIAFRKGRTFSVRDMNRTQTYLARLGIFNAISISPYVDTTATGKRDELNVMIDATFDKPYEITMEANASSKSNSYIGPGLMLGMTNKNLFGGGEQLSVKLSGSYEWQTGSGNKGGIFNSYEMGLNTSLAFPRLLAPRFVPKSRYNLNWTRFQLGVDLLNRPHYFKMLQFNASVNYDWRFRRHVQNTFTPFKLTYTKTTNTTETFDSIVAANPAVAQSFKSQYIPQMIYTYTYDRAFDDRNNLNWTFTVQEAGNVFWGIYSLCGKKGEKKLFGTPFSQFVKGQCQLVYGRRIGEGDNWIYSRVAAGVAHAYGNSSEVPYAEQFYVGGANSVRAFTVRSIGPGSYRAPKGSPEDYFDETGNFKFEANIEYRFHIAGPLHGAAFLDAGNVWLLKNDPLRPGGKLEGKNFFKELATGTGLGLRLDISLLVVRADLGIGIHAPYDTGKSGYYNMENFRKSLALHIAIGYPF